MKKPDGGGGIVFRGVTIPKNFQDIASAYKYQADNSTWVLITRSGIYLASFSTNAELETWWRQFQESKGRKPRPVQNAQSWHISQLATERRRAGSKKRQINSACSAGTNKERG